MPSLGALVCVGVGAWLVATLLYQYVPVQVAVDRRTPIKLFPSWTFFAPNPAYHDYHLVARVLRRDGKLGPCTAIGDHSNRRLRHLLWHPGKRQRRILQDAMQSVKRLRKWSTSDQVVQCSLPYLMLLHQVTTHYPRDPDDYSIQFVVVETSGTDGQRVWISFVSGFHRL